MRRFDPLDLAEAQGLSSEMLEAYILRTGWCHHSGSIFKKTLGNPPREVSFRCSNIWGIGDADLDALAQFEGRTVQALLWDMNPRLRPGLPSEEVRRLHGAGLWVLKVPWRQWPVLARFVELREADHKPLLPLLVPGESRPIPLHEIGEEWLFWPADASGNKVFWYERDGEMI